MLYKKYIYYTLFIFFYSSSYVLAEGNWAYKINVTTKIKYKKTWLLSRKGENIIFNNKVYSKEFLFKSPALWEQLKHYSKKSFPLNCFEGTYTFKNLQTNDVIKGCIEDKEFKLLHKSLNLL